MYEITENDWELFNNASWYDRELDAMWSDEEIVFA